MNLPKVGNLTQDLRIVSREQIGYARPKGYDVIVYEITKEGRILRGKGAGESQFVPERKFPFRRPEYVSFVVNMSEDLRYTFSLPFTHKASHSFDLTFDVSFRVLNSEELVTRLENDPFRLVCDEIARVIGSKVMSMSSEDIVISRKRDNFDAASKTLWDTEKQHLGEHANRHGLALSSVVTRVGLPPGIEEVIKTEEEAARQRAMDSPKRELDKIERERQAHNQVESIKAQEGVATAQHHLDVVQERHKITLTGLRGQADLAAGAVTAAIRALEQTSGNIHTIEDLRKGLQFIRYDVQQMLPGAADAQGSGRRRAVLPSDGDIPLLLDGPDAPELVTLLREILQQYGTFATEVGRKRQFLATVLHWVAELSLPDQANAGRLDEYRAALEEHRPHDLDGRRFSLLQELLEEQEIRARLA